MRLFTSLTLVVGFALGPASAAHGQSAPAAADSAVMWAVVRAALVPLADEVLAGASRSASARPWAIAVADSTAPVWRGVPALLGRVLHARPVGAADARVRDVWIEAVRVRGDTLRALIWVGERRRCATGWSGGATGYEFRTVRRGGQWAPALPVATQWRDPGVCPG